MPDTMVDTEVIKSAVQLACRAPSLHNSQPWRWVADGASLKLFVDRDRVVHSTDRSGREAIISCGVVLDHLRVAIAAAGWKANVERFPNPNNLDHLATVDFSPMDFVTDAHRRRADAILSRRHRPAALCGAAGLGIVRTDPAGRRRGQHRATGRDRRGSQARIGRGLPAHRIAAAVRFVLPRRTRLVDSAFRDDRRYTAQLSGLCGRKRTGRHRPHVPGDPAQRATSRHRRGQVEGAGALHRGRHPSRRHWPVARCCLRCCWTPRWPAWRPAR